MMLLCLCVSFSLSSLFDPFPIEFIIFTLLLVGRLYLWLKAAPK